MSGIELKGICKSFPGKNSVINNLSINVFKKELLILTGPSGCGKSTLLRLIAGLEEPCQGDIYIDSQLANYIDPVERNIAIVYQNLNLYPEMNIFENIQFGLKFRKLNSKHIKEKIMNIAEILDISNLLLKYPKDLDVFERQRIAFARAAVKSPRVFLVDRVSTDYNNSIKKKLYEEIDIIHKKLQASMIVAIDSNIAPINMGDRTAVMNNGHIEQIGTYEELYNAPLNRFVTAFMGKGYISFIKTMVSRNGEELYLNLGKTAMVLGAVKAKLLKSNNYVGKEIITALRPEDVHIDENFSRENTIEVKIQEVETVNDESFLSLAADGFNFYAKTSENMCWRKGQALRPAIDINKGLLIDMVTEKVIM